MGGSSGRGRGFTEINVTPLVDVMLVLLIVFMVTAPLLSTGLRVELPQVAAEATNLRDTMLVVTVTADDRIVFEDRDVTDSLERVLFDDTRIQTSREVYVRADKNAHYGPVARVVAAARAAGVDGINLLVEPDPEPPASDSDEDEDEGKGG